MLPNRTQRKIVHYEKVSTLNFFLFFLIFFFIIIILNVGGQLFISHFSPVPETSATNTCLHPIVEYIIVTALCVCISYTCACMYVCVYVYVYDEYVCACTVWCACLSACTCVLTFIHFLDHFVMFISVFSVV